MTVGAGGTDPVLQDQDGEATGGGRVAAARVVVVEDEALVALALTRQLASLGCDVVGNVSDAASAVELARSLGPDVVLMDLGLADGGGIEAIRTITSETPARVVVVTAHGAERSRQARRAGAFMVLAKPVVAAQLGRAIAQACRGRTSEDSPAR